MTASPDDRPGPLSGFRILAACALLVGLAMTQDPGFLSSDTKFDLAAAPVDFLRRALHLWDQEGAFGQLQNQAYGYLWPMGPFFSLGALAAVPAWVVQRLWLGLVLAVAFGGTAKVARALGVRSDFACFVAAFAYALSPRMVTTLGPISIEAWPSALVPWVLLPLVVGSTSGSPRRAAALSALAVAMVGGVNAAATLAVLPLGALWLLTRTPGPRRRSMMLWWPAFTALGTLWWLVPLFVMGAYSPPFLDYIESTSVTTIPTTLFDALRGTSNWVPYIDADSRAGRDLLATGYIVINSSVVLALGFAGLLHRRTPERRFLALGVLVGVLMVTAGHLGPVEGWFAAAQADLLDGVLAPLRNVHKFDPVLRLPLVVGLAFALDHLRAASGVPAGTDETFIRANRVSVSGFACMAVALAALPALSGRVVPAGAFLDVPDYWEQTAAWLDTDYAEHAEDSGSRGTALLIPGAAFGTYVWGSPRDEPLQWLTDSPWAVRNIIPLTPPNNIRMLDTVEDRLNQGRGSPGLVDYLRRAGVRHLVVRNDLEPSFDIPDPVLVHQTIADSPGLERVQTFGPMVGGEPYLEDGRRRVLINGGWQASYPAVEIFEVPDVDPVASTAVPTVVVGGPEDLLDLADLGVIGGGPTVLAPDLDGAPPGDLVLTDGLQDRERFYGRVHDAYSAVLTPGDVRRSGNPSQDYLEPRQRSWLTTARLTGAQALAASSSMSDSTTIGGARPGRSPYAAVDGDPGTHWTSSVGRDGPHWWQLTLDDAPTPIAVSLTGGADAAPDQRVVVRTEAGVSPPIDLAAGEVREVALDGTPTDQVRVEEASGSPGRLLSLAEVEIAGVDVRRSLVLPSVPDEWGNPDVVVLRALRDHRAGCVSIGADVPCVPGRERPSEEPGSLDRVLPLAEPGSFDADLTAVPVAGRALDILVLDGQAIDASASSVAVPDPRASAVAALDGNRGTAWAADVDDLSPTLSLSWLGRRPVSAIRMSVRPDLPVRAPREIVLTWPGGSRTVTLSPSGKARFPVIRTDQLRIQVTRAADAVGLDFDGQALPLGIGIGELRLRGVPYDPVRLSLDPRTFPCGTGPSLTLDARTWETSVTASPLALLRGLPVATTRCEAGDAGNAADPVDPDGPVSVGSGELDVSVAASEAFAPANLVLTDADATPQPSADLGGALLAREPASRDLDPPPGASVVGIRENANPGWVSTLDGTPLRPVLLDGWQQGWVLPEDADDDGVLRSEFGPDPVYRLALLGGLFALLGLLLAVAVLQRRRPGESLPALGERALPGWAMGGLALLAAGLVAGTVGLAVAVVAAGLGVVLHRYAAGTGVWLLAAACPVAGLWYFATPWGSPSGWGGNAAAPHYVVLVPLVCLLVWAALDGEGRRILPRRAGSSTSR
ncbi:MAG: alpha-(1-_3)-arabinofuranosyltransferase [Nocardioides sp.]